MIENFYPNINMFNMPTSFDNSMTYYEVVSRLMKIANDCINQSNDTQYRQDILEMKYDDFLNGVNNGKDLLEEIKSFFDSHKEILDLLNMRDNVNKLLKKVDDLSQAFSTGAEYGISADNEDNYEQIQKAIDDNAYGKLILPQGTINFSKTLKISSDIGIQIEGMSNSADTIYGTILRYTGEGDALEIINETGHNDRHSTISNLTIIGGASGGVIRMKNVHKIYLDRLWLCGCMGIGVYMESCWGCKISNTVITDCGNNGIMMYKRNNSVTVNNCTITNNCTQTGNCSNILLEGEIGEENLNVRIINCNIENAGMSGVTDKKNICDITVGHTYSCIIDNNYIEGSLGDIIYIGNGVASVSITGNYIQDGRVIIEGNVNGGLVENNAFYKQAKSTELIINSPQPNGINVRSNSFLNGAVKYLDIGQVEQRNIGYASGIPTSGAWKYRDIVYNNNPVVGSPIGWICVNDVGDVVWKPFGVIFDNE